MKKLLSIAAGLLLTTTAHASIIGFDDANVQGGTISYLGGANPLVGTDIIFDIVNGQSTPLNAGVALECRGCLLNFETGNFLAAVPGGFAFASGGSLSLTGDVYEGVTLIASGVLAAGSFSAPSVALGGGGSGLFIGEGTDTKPLALTDYFGLPNEQFSFVTSQLALNSCGSAGAGGFSCTVTDADFNNSQVVPTPASLALLGIGLLGLARVRRKA